MANSGMFDGLILVATVFAAGAALLLAFGLRLRLAHVRADARIAAYVVAPGLGDSSLDDMPSLRERVVLPFVSWAAGLVDRALPEKQVERIRINLAMAGFGSALRRRPRRSRSALPGRRRVGRLSGHRPRRRRRCHRLLPARRLAWTPHRT